MRGRWQLFISNLIVFSAWYILIYAVTADGVEGVLAALGGALAALAVGLIAGVIVGAAAHAIDLHLTHRGVRSGDARDGARVTLGKLPERAAPPAPPAADPAGVPPTGDVGVPPTPADTPPTSAASPAPAGPAGVPPTADAGAPPASAECLAACCAVFARGHRAVKVAPAASGGGLTGSIDRYASPDDFSDFIALVTALVDEGTDVSAVAITQDADGVPASVTFPISDDEKGSQA